jgi:hypothetical protein
MSNIKTNVTDFGLNLKHYNRCNAYSKIRQQRCVLHQNKGLFCQDHWQDQVSYREFRDFGFTVDWVDPDLIIQPPKQYYKVSKDWLLNHYTEEQLMDISAQGVDIELIS